jgi:hypothetical protein
MGRKAPYAFAATVATLLTTGALSAAVVESGKINVTNSASPLSFDFTGQSDLPLIKGNSTLVGIESYWTFTPGSGQTGNMDLLANLYTPSFASGVDTKVGFSTNIDLGAGAQNASSTYAAQKGLTFSSQVIQSLLASGHDVGAELVGAGAGFSNLQTFLDNGGKAEGYIRLITVEANGGQPPGGGGGGDPTPEPASMLVWGAVALGALAKKRSKAVAV